MAINAVQICVLQRILGGPDKRLNQQILFELLKNNSIAHRSLYTAATVAAASVRCLVKNNSTSLLSSS
jgi:hypothetical protein